MRTAEARASDSFMVACSLSAACPSSATSGNCWGCILSTTAIASSIANEAGPISALSCPNATRSTILVMSPDVTNERGDRSGHPSWSW